MRWEHPLCAALGLLLAVPALGQTGPISPTACLRKAALDLTRKGPPAGDLADLRSGARSHEQLVEGYLHSDAFLATAFDWFRSFFAPTPMTRGDAAEPARIARYLIAQDGDFRGLVNGRFTVDPNGNRVDRPDGAGVLTTQAFLSSHQGLEGRNWAGNVMRSLLDLHLTPITSVAQGTDTSRGGLAAIPGCAVCHVHPVYPIDGLGAFRACYDSNGLPLSACPAPTGIFFGRPGSTMPELGIILGESPEFTAAMIQLFARRTFGRALGRNEIPFYRSLEGAFVGSGYQVRPLLKAILTSPQYCSR